MILQRTCVIFLFVLASSAIAQREIPEADFPDDEGAPSKRFSSYYLNYYDEMAMSVCASIPSSGSGYVYPVRRKCQSKSKQNCEQLCTSAGVRKQATWGGKLRNECLESLHIYKHRPRLAANPGTNTDVGRVGLLMYRYHSCKHSGCGPNYCCCRRGN